MQIRIFCNEDGDEHLLEETIQEWLDENGPVSITQILQTESASEGFWNLTITIFYIE